jgi:hypothetical protein
VKTNSQARNAFRISRKSSAIQDRLDYIRQTFGAESGRCLPEAMSVAASSARKS